MKKEILFVDDDIKILSIVERAVNRSGLNVGIRITPSCREAVFLLENTEIKLLITDLMMPEMNGFDLIEKAKKLRPEIKTILMSGSRLTEYELESRIFDYFIAKPFDIEHLRTMVGKIFEAGKIQDVE
jgi:DNA-binding NtrC family response regulator